MGKIRLDVFLTEKGYFPSREKARTAIMEGLVFIDNVREDKPGTMIKEDASVEIKGETLPFVSRGGLKLKKAVDEFGLGFSGMTCLDIGASTGGFTDCMLQNGAKKVYAVDSGYGQLDYKLRCDERVISLERTNARYLTNEEVPEEIDFASFDVAFISLKKVIPPVIPLLKEGGEMVCLIKPQFEAGREKVGKKGVVRDSSVHKEVIRDIIDFCREEKLLILNLSYSPIKGPEGNIEYLLHLRKAKEGNDNPTDIDSVVEEANRSLKE